MLRPLALLLALAPAAAAAPAPTLGTPLVWHADAAEAGALAAREGKLVLQVLVSGDFTRAREISLPGERLREVLRDPGLRSLLGRFVGAHQTAGAVTLIRRNRATWMRMPGGGAALLILTPTGRVIHAVAGARSADELARELRWALRHADDDARAAAHRAAARRLSRLRVLKPVTPQEVGDRLIDLGVRIGSAPSPRLQQALIHHHLAARPGAAAAETGAYVWTEILGQKPSTQPVTRVDMRIRCRIPIRFRCGVRRIKPLELERLVKEAKRLLRRMPKRRPRAAIR